MPNWVKHNVVIKGDKEVISKVYEQITKGEDGFSFKNIIPMPEELKLPENNLAYYADEWRKGDAQKKKEIEDKVKQCVDEGESVSEKMQQYADNITKYGFPTWYGWSIDKWGTKWDAHEAYDDHYDGNIILNFDTAWNTPMKVFIALSKQYPTINIYAAFADEDLGWNCGEYEIKGGMVTSEKEGDFDFACEVWGYDKEDLEDMGIEVD
jgi:hypothetical protein